TSAPSPAMTMPLSPSLSSVHLLTTAPSPVICSPPSQPVSVQDVTTASSAIRLMPALPVFTNLHLVRVMPVSLGGRRGGARPPAADECRRVRRETVTSLLFTTGPGPPR